MKTCRETLDWMLEAEPSELTGRGNSEIAVHLASCRACHARVERIIGDAAWLARAVPLASTTLVPDSVVPASPRTWWTRPACVGTALVAASLLIVFLTRGSRPNRNSTAQLHDVAVAPAMRRVTTDRVVNQVGEQRVALGEQARAPAQRSASPETATRLPAAQAIRPVAITSAFVAPIPARAVRLDTTHFDSGPAPLEPRASVAIDAGPSTGRYAVLQSTPKVTVVWFY